VPYEKRSGMAQRLSRARAIARVLPELPPFFALHFLLELIPLCFLFDEAGAIPELGFPFASPLRADTVLALDLALELPAL